jgi:glyoxylase-like metal-dependent hydrolase (beta-lactamase superfamily II)
MNVHLELSGLGQTGEVRSNWTKVSAIPSYRVVGRFFAWLTGILKADAGAFLTDTKVFADTNVQLPRMCAPVLINLVTADVKHASLVAVLMSATAVCGTQMSAAADAHVKSGVDRLYVIDCGDGSGQDESRWTPGANIGTPVGFPGHCYLIHHAQGWFLWDTGVDDAVAQLPNHELVLHEWGPGTGPIWRKPLTLAAQLEQIHVRPSDIKLMAVSHSHPDHAGNVEMFPNTLMLVQRVEYEWAGSRQDTVAFNKKHPVKLIDGDYDIFGDGSLVLLSTPGHTPGHQSLLVRLPVTGPVILSGDVVHFQTSFDHRYVPGNNWNEQASLQSMDRIAAIMAKEHAQLWINHDQAQSDRQKKLPQYYE